MGLNAGTAVLERRTSMRLIDADIADVVIIYDKSNELTQVSAIREYIKRQKAFLDMFPTIDAVPVVRCKDCKNRFEDSWCEYVDDDDNFYCARGERKEGADNG